MGIDKRRQHIKQFLKLGRIGSKFYLFGGPEDIKGPYDHPKEATKVLDEVLDNFKDYEVVDRKVRRKVVEE